MHEVLIYFLSDLMFLKSSEQITFIAGNLNGSKMKLKLNPLGVIHISNITDFSLCL